MDVNPQVSKSGLPEHNNAQIPDTYRLALIHPSGTSHWMPFANLRPQGVEKCSRVTPCARVSVHDRVVVPELARSCRTLASL
jgi:hypothetical protein